MAVSEAVAIHNKVMEAVVVDTDMKDIMDIMDTEEVASMDKLYNLKLL